MFTMTTTICINFTACGSVFFPTLPSGGGRGGGGGKGIGGGQRVPFDLWPGLSQVRHHDSLPLVTI